MFMYRRSSQLEVIGYSDSYFAKCLDNRKSTFGYLFLLVEGVVSWKVLNNLSLLHPPWK